MAVNWYDPTKPKTTAGGTVRSSYSPLPQTNQKAFAANNGEGEFKIGNITPTQLLDPATGFGTTFQASAKKGQVDALLGGMSQANPEDYAGLDELRDYYRGALADLPGQTNGRISSYDTQSQRGLANLLSQYKAANPNGVGTRQYAGAQGDITSRATQDYLNGLLNAKGAAIGQANQIQNGLSGVMNQNFNERQFQYNQGKGLADLYTTMINQDQGREGMLAQQAPKDDWMSSVLPAVGTIGGAIIGGPAGAMIGGSLGGAIGGAAGGGGGGGGYNPGMGLAQIMMQQQAMGGYKPTYVQPYSNPYGTVSGTNPATSYSGGSAPWWQ